MKKKKMIFSVLLVLLVGIVLFFYNEFNGNPISKFASKMVLNNYLSDTYPDREFRIENGTYDFKFSTYVFDVIEIGESSNEDGKPEQYEFQVNGSVIPNVHWDGIYYDNLDTSLMEKLSSQASREITEVISEKMDIVTGIEVHIELLKGDYPSDTDWNKNLKTQKPLDMWIQLDSTNQTKEEFLQSTKEIQKLLNENNYNYEYVSMNGQSFDDKFEHKDDEGYVKFATSFEKDGSVKEVEVYNQ